MRWSFILVFALFLVTGFTSCKHCVKCTKYPPGDTQEFCRSDYASDQSYSDAYHQLEAAGYTCE